MNGGRKAAGIGCSVVLLLVVALWIAIAVSPRPEGGMGAVHGIFGFLSVLIVVMIWRFFKGGSVSAAAEVPDLLRQTLHLGVLPEKDGLQWTLLSFPDALQAPGHFVVAVLVQNCFDRPRRVRLTLKSSLPGLPGRAEEFPVAGGQAGLFRVPFLLPAGSPPGTLILEALVEGSAPDGKGRRVIRATGVAPRTAPHFRQLSLEILEGAPAEPLNAFAKDWRGFQSIAEPGQPAPNLEPLRLLDELRGRL